ncbi:response regulator [Agrobacterium vitis]|uniref:response regulator n=1 Tax=Agrobacterium vitis TaxID=373 RepID=UPI003D2C556A
MKNILVVDDDVAIGRMLVDYLSQHDFRISTVEDSTQMERHLAMETPDLLIVDMNLGNEDGMQIVRGLTETLDVPIIIISGKRLDEVDKVTGLELGARDYVAKPFSLREMLARVRTALKSRDQQSGTLPAQIYTFDAWRLNTRHRRLKDPSGQEIKLTAGEFNLLVAFLNAPRQALSREQLLLATRIHDQEIFDRSVDVLILRLRRKLAQNTTDRQYIKTQRGAGYLFDCSVELQVPRRRLQ